MIANLLAKVSILSEKNNFYASFFTIHSSLFTFHYSLGRSPLSVSDDVH